MQFIFKVSIIILLSSSCTNFFLQPDRLHYADPENEFKLEYKDIYFPSVEKMKLHAQYIKGTGKRKGLILVFHGNAQNLSSHFMNFVWLPAEGYDYIIVDWRGYGRSWGERELEGTISDTIQAMNLTREIVKKKKYQKFIVYGQSLGGAIALKALSKIPYMNEISFLVLDSTFVNYKKVAFDILKSNFLTFIFSPLAYILVSNKYSPEEVVPTLKMPVLVIHSKTDDVVSYRNGKEIFDLLTTKKKWFWSFDKGEHIDTFVRENKIYQKKFVNLLLEGS